MMGNKKNKILIVMLGGCILFWGLSFFLTLLLLKGPQFLFGSNILQRKAIWLLSGIVFGSVGFLLGKLFSDKQGKHQAPDLSLVDSISFSFIEPSYLSGMWKQDLQTGKMEFSTKMKSWFIAKNYSIPTHIHEYLLCIHPDDQIFVKETYQQAFAQQQEFIHTYRLILPDHSMIWVEEQVQFLRTQDSLSLYCIGFITDITKKKAVEEERAIFFAIAEKDSECIVITDQEGNLVYINPAGKKMIGISKETSIDTLSLSSFWTPDDVDKESQFFSHPTQNRSSSLTGVLRHQKTQMLLSVDSQLSLIEVPNLINNSFSFYYCYRFSQTEQLETKENQITELLQLALKAGKMGTWDHYFSTKEIIWLEGTSALFGRPEGIYEGTYEEFFSYVDPSDRKSIEQIIRNSIQTNGEFQIEFRTIWPDESIHWIQARGKVFFNEHHQPIRSIGVAMDISERKNFEESMRSQNDQLVTLLEANPVGIILQDSQGRIKNANQAFLKLSGYLQEDIKAGIVFGEAPRISRLSTNKNMDSKSSESIFSFYEQEYTRKDGKKIPIRVGLITNSKQQEESFRFIWDLTENHQNQEESKRNRLLFQRIAETTPDIIYVHDLGEQQNIYVNRAASQILGYPLEELIQMPNQIMTTLVHPEDREVVFSIYQQFFTLEDGNVLELEYRMKHASGHYRWFRNRGVVFSRNSEGLPLQIMGICQDITEQKRANQALLQSEERERARAQELAALMNAVPATVWISHDPNCQKITGNRAAYQLLRMDERTHPSLTCATNENKTSPFRIFRDGKEISIQELPLQVASSQGIEVREAEFSIIFEDGTQKQLYGNATPIRTARGQLRGAIAIFMDITERLLAEQSLRVSEERFRSLVAATAAVVWTADANGHFISSQETWELYTGQIWPEYQNKVWFSMIHPDDQENISLGWKEALFTRSLYEIETRLFSTASQRYRHVTIRAVPLLYADGTLREWVGAVIDIHEQKQAEEIKQHLLNQEKTAREEAERANRMKDEFLATVSHELRTPLTAIMGWIHMLKTEDVDQATATMAIETIERNARSQAQLIEDILDVSRIITGKLRLQTSLVSCTEILQSALDSVRPAIQSKGIVLEVEVPENMKPLIADANRLQQIIWNLLSNALKFTPRKGSISVQLEELEHQICIRVKDTGEGISPDFLPYVFDRFRQADGTMTRKHSGLGLGLAIVRHLVELHGGTIQAESLGKGQGATFSIFLPYRASELGLAEPTPLRLNSSTLVFQAPTNPASSLQLKGLSILIIDDAPDILTMLSTILQNCGASIKTASSAQEGLILLEQYPIDVLISDLAMPEEDGYSFIRKVRRLPQQEKAKTPAIALTAHARVEDRVRALSAGFQMFVAKPLEPAEIISVICDLSRTKTSGNTIRN